MNIRHTDRTTLTTHSGRGLSLLLAGLLLWGASPPLLAHFPILIHDAALASTEGEVTVTFATGHPFELEWIPATHPERFQSVDAQGRVADRRDRLTETSFRGDDRGKAWQIRLEPERGDSWIAVDAAPELEESDKVVYQEYAKVCIHRGRQGGWSQRTGQPLEIVPLTRPYGIRPGMVFTGRLMRGVVPVADTEVYWERLNEERPDPERLPAEPWVTYVARTDSEGRFAVSLPDAGWWIIGAYVDEIGSVRRQNEDYRLEGFAGLWVRVEPTPRGGLQSRGGNAADGRSGTVSR